jgi:hypothetical protein
MRNRRQGRGLAVWWLLNDVLLMAIATWSRMHTRGLSSLPLCFAFIFYVVLRAASRFGIISRLDYAFVDTLSFDRPATIALH